jgi:hypothetical protein
MFPLRGYGLCRNSSAISVYCYSEVYVYNAHSVMPGSFAYYVDVDNVSVICSAINKHNTVVRDCDIIDHERRKEMYGTVPYNTEQARISIQAMIFKPRWLALVCNIFIFNCMTCTRPSASAHVCNCPSYLDTCRSQSAEYRDNMHTWRVLRIYTAAPCMHSTRARLPNTHLDVHVSIGARYGKCAEQGGWCV